MQSMTWTHGFWWPNLNLSLKSIPTVLKFTCTNLKQALLRAFSYSTFLYYWKYCTFHQKPNKQMVQTHQINLWKTSTCSIICHAIRPWTYFNEYIMNGDISYESQCEKAWIQLWEGQTLSVYLYVLCFNCPLSWQSLQGNIMLLGWMSTSL